MSISSTNRKAGPFTGNGTASSFPFYFKVFEATDLLVVLLNITTNVETELQITSNYTVSLNANQDATPGGTVTLVSGALASGYKLTITSNIGNLQPTNLTNQGGFYPDVVEDALDRATIQIQQNAVTLDRSIKVPLSSNVNTELPNPEENTLLGWDANGNIINYDPASLASVVAYATAYADTFTGDGTTTSWVLTRNPGTLYNLDVSINGVTQVPVTDYNLSGTTFTTTTAAPLNAVILVKYKEGLPNYSGDSQDVRYLPSGTGAVATTVQAKLRETVSVKDFGAVGDGVTDDTAAIQAAMNTGYAEVYFPSGNYKTTSTIYIKQSQTICGTAVSLLAPATSSQCSTIMFVPSGGDKVAIKNTVGTNGNSIRNIGIKLNSANHYGIQLSTTYGNIIDGVLFFGTFDIGVMIQDAYVCDINRVTMNGCTIKRFGIYIGASNSIKISRFHTSVLPQDAATCLYGLAIYGSGKDYTISDCLFQGQTIGIALNNSGVVSTNILNGYFENTVLPLRCGNTSNGTGPTAVTIIGGQYAGAYVSHPQYVSRGPIIWLQYGTRFSIKGARFDDTPAPASATGPWSILCGTGQAGVNVESCSIYGTTQMKDLVMRESAGASPSVTIVGDTYGSYSATELVLKKDGAYGGTSYGIRVDTAGVVTTSAYSPTVISGTPAALISNTLPAPATLLL